jgi:hypothetical protein
VEKGRPQAHTQLMRFHPRLDYFEVAGLVVIAISVIACAVLVFL